MVRSLIGGSGDSGRMVCTPAPGILKVTTLSCAAVCAATASVMACRSEPAPLSLVLVTVKVAAWAEESASRAQISAIGEILNTGAPGMRAGWPCLGIRDPPAFRTCPGRQGIPYESATPPCSHRSSCMNALLRSAVLAALLGAGVAACSKPDAQTSATELAAAIEDTTGGSGVPEVAAAGDPCALLSKGE